MLYSQPARNTPVGTSPPEVLTTGIGTVARDCVKNQGTNGRVSVRESANRLSNRHDLRYGAQAEIGLMNGSEAIFTHPTGERETGCEYRI
jgi:hypothetical protein